MDNFHLKIIVQQGFHLKDEGEISSQETVLETRMEASQEDDFALCFWYTFCMTLDWKRLTFKTSYFKQETQ